MFNDHYYMQAHSEISNGHSLRYHFFYLGFFLVLLMVGCSGSSKQPPQPEPIIAHSTAYSSDTDGKSEFAMSERQARQKAGQVLDTLTLREKIGQLFFISARGRYMSEQTEPYIKLTEKVRQEQIGGILFFKGYVYGQTKLTNKLQQLSPLPLWITQDMEFGAAMRVKGTTTLPPAMAIAATQNVKHAQKAGFITAMEARALGVHQIFAPVVDVNNNPENPVINVRSFGGTPELVSRYGDAFIKGVQSAGVIPTAKHFPGHGDTQRDSHVQLPVIQSNYKDLRSLELIPFISAINAGVNSIMSAHISFPKISTNHRMPATMDPAILNRILRDSLNFNGLVVTDALDMRGITNNFSVGEAALKALQAGSDILLISPDETAAIHHILQAVREGKLNEKQINRSTRKLLTWKFRKGLFKERSVNIDGLAEQINLPKYEAAARHIARESITVLSNKMDILPIHTEEYPSICAIALADDRSGDTGTPMAELLRQYHTNITFYTFDRRSGVEEKRRIRRCARQADLLVIGSFIYVKTHQDITLNREQRRFIRSLSSYKNPEVLISFGNPYIFKDIPHAEVDMQAWAPFDIQLKAAVEALFGASPIGGKMPIRLPGHFQKGDGKQIPQSSPAITIGRTPVISGSMSRNLRRKFSRAIRDSVFPGAILTIMEDGKPIYNTSFGYQSYEKRKQLDELAKYTFSRLSYELVGIPMLLKTFGNNTFKTDFTMLADSVDRKNPRSVINQFQRLKQKTSSSTGTWKQLHRVFKTKGINSLNRLLNSNLWTPLEMHDSQLKYSKENQSAKSNILLRTTSVDLSKLVFSLMNNGNYKDRNLFPDSLIAHYLTQLPERKFSSQTYRQLGTGYSRIWIDLQNNRSITLLIPDSIDHNTTIDRERLSRFRRQLIQIIEEKLLDHQNLLSSKKGSLSRS